MDRLEKDKPAENAMAFDFAPTKEELAECREMMKYDFGPTKEIEKATMSYSASGNSNGVQSEETRIDGLRLPDQSKDDPTSYTFTYSEDHQEPNVKTAVFKRNQDGQLEPVTDENIKANINELAGFMMNRESMQRAQNLCRNVLLDAGESPDKYLPKLDADFLSEDARPVPFYDNTIYPPNSDADLDLGAAADKSVPYYDNTVYPPNSGSDADLDLDLAKTVPYYDNTILPPAAPLGNKKSGRPNW